MSDILGSSVARVIEEGQTCLRPAMAKSGRRVSVRLVGKGATVAERPMTDQECLEAALAAFEPP